MTPLLPPEALKNHVAVLGKTGSGKTSTGKRLVEEVVAGGARVCILDPLKSDWRGMVTSADGTLPGLPFVILGGPSGALPLSPKAGGALGALVARGTLPLSILDMADFGAGELHRFFAAFAEALFRNMRGVVWLVVEEAHEFAPKERSNIGDESMALHWAKKLASAGRSKGVRLLVSSQRVQKLHNDFWGSAETLFLHRLTTPADQDAPLKWVKANAGKARADEVAADLARLKTGTAWVMSGEAGIFERRDIPKFSTYDNASTPDGADEDARLATACVDVAALRETLGAAVAEAEANDPKTLRAEIAALKRRIVDYECVTHTDPDEIAKARQDGVVSGANATLRGLREDMAHLLPPETDEIETLRQEFARAIAGFEEVLRVRRAEFLARLGGPAVVHAEDVRGILAAAPGETAPAAVVPQDDPPPRTRAVSQDAPSLSAPEARVLDALVLWDALKQAAPSRAMVAIAARYKPNTGNFNNVVGALVRKGLAAIPSAGLLALTDIGASAAGPAAPMRRGEVIDRARAILSGPQARVFDALVRHGETGRDDLAIASGYTPNTGNFNNLVGALCTLQIATKPAPGRVRLAEWLR